VGHLGAVPEELEPRFRGPAFSKMGLGKTLKGRQPGRLQRGKGGEFTPGSILVEAGGTMHSLSVEGFDPHPRRKGKKRYRGEHL